MSAQKKYTVEISLTYELPADLNEREDLYGTSDPTECVTIDLDNDPVATLTEYGSDHRIIRVVPW